MCRWVKKTISTSSLKSTPQDDDDQLLVEVVVLEHVVEHLQAQPAGLTPDHSPLLV